MKRDYKNTTKKPFFLNLDADTIGHYLVVLSDRHTHLDEQIREQQMLITEDQMFELYLLGNIEGRVLNNRAIASDLELLDLWEQELPTEEVYICPQYKERTFLHLGASDINSLVEAMGVACAEAQEMLENSYGLEKVLFETQYEDEQRLLARLKRAQQSFR